MIILKQDWGSAWMAVTQDQWTLWNVASISGFSQIVLVASVTDILHAAQKAHVDNVKDTLKVQIVINANQDSGEIQ